MDRTERPTHEYVVEFMTTVLVTADHELTPEQVAEHAWVNLANDEGVEFELNPDQTLQ